MSVISIGEILWDRFPDRSLIGGAPFNAAAHAHKCGERVYFVSAVGDDELGKQALREVEALGLDPRHIRVTDEAPTGVVDVFLDAGTPDYTIERPAAYDCPSLRSDDFAFLQASRPEWIYYGTLAQMGPRAHATTCQLFEAFPNARRFYDVNLRKDSYTPDLIDALLRDATVLKLNGDELRTIGREFDIPSSDIKEAAEALSAKYAIECVCVTRAAEGCAVWRDGKTVEAEGWPVDVVDEVGAGDAFSAAFIHGYNDGRSLPETLDFANRLGALVASRSGAIPDWTRADAMALSRRE